MAMNPHFLYFTWEERPRSKFLELRNDALSTVAIKSSVGVYKNVYGDAVLDKNHESYWEIKIVKGNYFKIGVIKQSEIGNVKKAFSDLKEGFAYYSVGKLRNGANNEGADFIKGYGAGDTIKVLFEPKAGTLSFALNDSAFQLAFTHEGFKKGSYVPAVGALMQGSKFSLTLPNLQD